MPNSIYTDLDGTNFPDKVDSWEKFLDPTVSTQAAINAYYACINGGDFDGAANILENTPELNQMIINAKRMNQIRDAVIALERFFDDNVYDYIVDMVKDFGTWSGIKAYKKYSVVDYTLKGSTLFYMSIQDVPVGVPPTETRYWKCITLQGRRGDSGLGLTPKGAWKKDEDYIKDDLVTYNNALWAANVANTEQPPSTDSSYWYLVMSMKDLYSEDLLISVSVGEWAGDSAPYINRIKVEDMVSTTSPVYGLIPASSMATEEEIEAYSHITDLVCDDGYVTLYADEIPSMTFTIVIKGYMSKSSGASINDISSLMSDVDSLNSMMGNLTYNFTKSDVNLLGASVNGACLVVHNNKIHMLGVGLDNKEHYLFDEISGELTKLSTMPDAFINGAAVSYGNKIHILGGENHPTGHYTWDEDDGWVLLDTELPYEFINGSAIIYNDAIHILGGTGEPSGHFQYDNDGKWDKFSTIPMDFVKGTAKVVGSYIYIFLDSVSMIYNNGWGDYTELSDNTSGAPCEVFGKAVLLFIGNTIYSYKKGKLNVVFTDSDAYSNGLIASIGNDFYVFGVNSSYRRYKVFSFYSVNVASQLEAINADISSIKSSVSTINNQIGGLSFSILDGDLVVTYNEGMEGNE